MNNPTQKITFDGIKIGSETKAILIDLDNTLYDYAPCHELALKAVHEKHYRDKGLSYEEFSESYSTAQKVVKSRIPHLGASHSRLLYFQNLSEIQNGKTNIKEALNSDQTYWSNFHKAVTLRKDAVKFLEDCKNNGLKICLVTDLTASVQFHKIVEIGAENLFDLIVTSEEAGVEKPAVAIFELALKKLGLSAGEVIMIGDDKHKDIHGAHAVGITAYLV